MLSGQRTLQTLVAFGEWLKREGCNTLGLHGDNFAYERYVNAISLAFILFYSLSFSFIRRNNGHWARSAT